MARVLVTGVGGCIGAWTARRLLEEGHSPIGADISEDLPRLGLVGAKGEFPVHRLDVRDEDGLTELLDAERPDAVIHLAALQIPFCKADPVGCVGINVGGLMLLLEAARHRGLGLAYASSAAVYGPDQGRRLPEGEGLRTATLYGVFKHANEEMARIYHQDYEVTSAGIRPHTVYGPGRDQGMTSDVTVALERAARGEPFQIRFGGDVALQHAEDVARAFIKAALDPRPGARVYNLRGSYASIEEVVSLIDEVTGARGLVTHADEPLPIAADLSEDRFQSDHGPFGYRDLKEGLEQTLEVWRRAGTVPVSPS